MSRNRWILTGLICLSSLGALQFMRPVLRTPPHQALLVGATVPADVGKIFEQACQDCHSNNTHWPWYAQISPAGALIARDVERGRSFLNLSEWQKYSTGRMLGYLASMAEAARTDRMPPKMYGLLHPSARLTPEQRARISSWAREERLRLRRPAAS